MSRQYSKDICSGLRRFFYSYPRHPWYFLLDYLPSYSDIMKNSVIEGRHGTYDMGHFIAFITTQLLLMSRSAEGVTLDAMFAWLVFWSVLIWNLSFALTMNKDAYLLNDVNSGHFTEFNFRLLARRWAVSGESNEN